MKEPRTNLGAALYLIGVLFRLLLWMMAVTLAVDAKERELLGRAWER